MLMVSGVLVIGGAIWYFVARPTTPVAVENAATLSRQSYDDLFQLNWRVTNQSGNVSVEATYFSPSLRVLLQNIDTPSSHQRAMQRALADIPLTATVFYVIITQPDPIIGAVDAPATVSYADTTHELTWSELDPLLLSPTNYAQRDGFVWTADEARNEALTLSITHPNNLVHTFTWNNLFDQ